MEDFKIRQKTVVGQVMEKMRELISSGAYRPGDQIPTEQVLSERFGVGRSSIREAIKIFNYLGVLESKTARGTYVCERSNISREAITWALLLGNDDLDSIIELRGAMELWSFIRIAGLSVSDPTRHSEILQDLAHVLESMRVSVEAGDYHALVQEDYAFHQTILNGSGNQLFISLFDILKSFLLHEIETSQASYKDMRKIHLEHKALYDALKSGDIAQAETSYTAHISNIKSILGIT